MKTLTTKLKRVCGWGWSAVCLGGAFLLITILFWILVTVSGWVVRDSYASDAFSKAHPILSIVISMVWVIGNFGGAYVVALVLIGLFCWLTLRKHPDL